MPSERQIPDKIVSLSEKKIQYFERCKRKESFKKKKCHCPTGNSKLSPVIKSKF